MTSIIEMREEIPIAFDAVFNVPKEGKYPIYITVFFLWRTS